MGERWKKHIRQFAAALIIAGFSFIPLLSAEAAGTASLSLSPSSGNIVNGATFSVVVNVTLQESTGSIQVFINYDPAKLQFLSINSSGSIFDSKLTETGGGGSVEISRYSFTPVSGSGKIATVNFKGLVNSGTSVLTFDSSTAIPTSDGNPTDQWNGSTTGGSYAHKAASSTPTPPPSNNPSNSPSGSNNNQSSSSGNSSTPVDDPVVVVDSNVEQNKTFQVAIIVKNSKNEPVEGADVTLGDRTEKTDATGVASFTGVSAGTYTAKVKSASFEKEETLTIDYDDDPAKVIEYEITGTTNEPSKNSRNKIIIITASSLAGLVILLLVAKQLLKARRLKALSKHVEAPAVTQDSSSLLGGDNQNMEQPSTVINPQAPQDKPDDFQQPPKIQ